MKWGRHFWPGFYILNWLIILGFWFKGAVVLLPDISWALALISFGRLIGLAAAHLILCQFFLMGRFPWLERVYGLDRLSRFHQWQGKLTFFFVVLHPLSLIWGYSLIFGISLWRQFINFLLPFQVITMAAVGATLLVVVVGISLYIIRSRVRYESWYFVHLLVYLAVFLAVWHQFTLGEDIVGSTFFYFYWLVLYTGVLTSHLIFRFLRPIYLFYQHGFTVSRLGRESPTTVSVYIAGRQLQKFLVRPGQFMIVRFLNKKLWWQAHPFSLSMMPDGRELRLTIKELGDFTREIKNLTPGTKIIIDGPYGVFTDLFSLSNKILLIAGGIGITPIRSLSEEMLAKSKDISLLYANRNQQEIVFKQELENLSQKYSVKITHILSEEPGYAGETGYLDQEKIKRLVPDVAEREVFLCGPPPMMEKLIVSLKALGVKPTLIHFEKFSF